MARQKAKLPAITHLRVTFTEDFYVGPGRADLLELIAETGSIAAAGRRMGMSYRRAWALVQALNDGFGAPLVHSVRGGKEQGAHLTAEGAAVLRAYRRMQDAAAKEAADEIAAVLNLMPK